MGVWDDCLTKFQKDKNQLILETANSILESTIQFFKNNPKCEPAPLGCGLLLSLEDKFFMVTVAHVIAEDYNNIFVILPDKELKLGASPKYPEILKFTSLPASGNRKDDKIDIAVMELKDKVITDILVTHKFIPLDNIEIGHNPVENPYYLSVGYPATKTKKVWNEEKILAKPYVYRTEFDPNFDLEKFGFASNSHIAIKFDGKVKSYKNNTVHNAPKLGGISGSGLWYLKDFAKPDMVKNKQLVGLIIERVSNVLVATRIDLVTEYIRQHFNLSIPKSKSKIQIIVNFK